jgi:hypothetical protein
LPKKIPNNLEISLQEICNHSVPNDLSLLELRKYESPPISNLIEIRPDGSKDKEKCYAFIKLIIVSVNQFFAVNWPPSQIQEVSKTFYSFYCHWRILDYIKFMERCKGLYYGKLYPTFAPGNLMDWAQSFNAEWFEVSIELSEQKNLEYKKDSSRELEIYKHEESIKRRTAENNRAKKSKKLK